MIFRIKNSKNINSLSGKNILQETTKQLAKSLVFERKLENEKSSKVGGQEEQTQQLLNYYNNKCFVDLQESNEKLKKNAVKRDLPYLKANSKVFNIDANPKYK